jgi:hypothetical protein
MKAKTSARQLRSLRIAVRRTWIFMKIGPLDAHGVGLRNLGGRMKYWGETGAFYGGMVGILCGFVLSSITKLGAVPMENMLLYWAALCVGGAVVVGGSCSLCVRLLPFKLSDHGRPLSVTAFPAAR